MRISLFTLAAAAAMLLCSLPAKAVNLPPTHQWEGSYDYAVVGGATLLDNCVRVQDMSGNILCLPYGDPSIPWGTPADMMGDTPVDWPNYRLSAGIPDDAQIQQAFLIWMASNSPGTPSTPWSPSCRRPAPSTTSAPTPSPSATSSTTPAD